MTLKRKQSLDVDLIIEKLLEARYMEPKTEINLPVDQIFMLIDEVVKVFMSQPVLLELPAPIKILGSSFPRRIISLGDTHGQYYELLRIFEQSGYPPESDYLFLGLFCFLFFMHSDYVDRGSNSIEIVCLLFAYKIKYPDHVFLLRGNHESDAMNQLYGFAEECARRYSPFLYHQFAECFRYMPISALVGTRILCMHGGLSPQLTSLDDIANVERPYDIPDEGLVCDLLWSDPKRGQIQAWEPNERGVSFTFSEDVVKDFLEKFDLDLICRAHQVVDEGYEFFADMRLLTLISAPNYGGEMDNSGAVLFVDENLVCSLLVVRPQEELPKYSIGDVEFEDEEYDDEIMEEEFADYISSVCYKQRTDDSDCSRVSERASGLLRSDSVASHCCGWDSVLGPVCRSAGWVRASPASECARPRAFRCGHGWDDSRRSAARCVSPASQASGVCSWVIVAWE